MFFFLLYYDVQLESCVVESSDKYIKKYALKIFKLAFVVNAPIITCDFKKECTLCVQFEQVKTVLNQVRLLNAK